MNGRKRATVVFIPVAVSILDQLETAIRRESLRVSDMSEELYSHGDDNGYKVGKSLQQKLDSVLWQVIKKNNKHNKDRCSND